MFVENVRAYFDLLIDEPDVTYITVAQRQAALAIAEENYRQAIIAVEEKAYAIEQDIAFTGTQEYDLGGAVSAPAPKARRPHWGSPAWHNRS